MISPPERSDALLNFQPWNQLLQRYVNQQGEVDYATWQQHSIGELQAWLEQISETDPLRLATEQQLALWLNLYNALVILAVLQQYPIDSIRPTILGIPNWIKFYRFFARSRYQLAGQRYSLNAIEHGVIRPQFQEPRIHFALVCAAKGCPLLRNQAYQPDSVYQQLDQEARRFINNPAKVNYDRQSQILYCSRIFQWYRSDFLKAASSVPVYIQTYWERSDQITLNDQTPVRYLDYSWDLNRS